MFLFFLNIKSQIFMYITLWIPLSFLLVNLTPDSETDELSYELDLDSGRWLVGFFFSSLLLFFDCRLIAND